jgi:hypothetical protein
MSMTDKPKPAPSEEALRALSESEADYERDQTLLNQADEVFSMLNAHIERNHFADKVRLAILGAA